MAAILPLVKKYDAAVIALPNDHDEIPMEWEKRLDLVAKIVRVATEEYGIAKADIVIDPLAMPIGADTGNSLVTMEAMRQIRDQHGLNMTCGASNVSFGMPDRHTLGAAWLPMAMTAGPDQRDHGHPHPADRGGGQGGRRLPQPRRLGHGLDRGAPGQGGCRRRDTHDRRAGRGVRPGRTPSRGADRQPGRRAPPSTTAPAGSTCRSPSRTRRRRRRSARSGCRRE